MKTLNDTGQKPIKMLIVIISDQQDIFIDDTGIAHKKIQIVDKMIVRPAQIALVNEKATSCGTFSDMLIICKNQLEEFKCLNEMVDVLYSSEKHGAAVALNRHSRGICGLTKEQYKKAAKYLGGYKVIPYIESVPALVKAEMFERFGPFDESLQSIEGALEEFSLRFNQYGWSVVRVACWSSIELCGTASTERDRDMIQKKYPYIHEVEEIYYRQAEKAAEHFIEVLAQENNHKPSLLFSLYELPSSFNGTTNYALKLLAAFYSLYHERYEISILVKRNTDEFHRLSGLYPRVYYPETVKHHTFHMGFAVSQILCAEHMDIINKCCLKYGICMLDIISLRSHYLSKNDPGRYELFRDSIEYADLMLSISQFSHDDIISFFHEEIQNTTLRTGVLYLGTDKKQSAATAEGVTVPFKTADYFIVIGNAYRHKMIEPTLAVLNDIDENFIVIGTKTEGYYRKSKRIYGYVSGWLDDNSLNQMIAGSKGIIFPSVYEGFGLTLYDAAVYHKKIIVSDTQINLELKKLLSGYSGNIVTYRRLEELKTILSENDFGDVWNERPINIRSWRETAEELETWLKSMLEEEIDIVRLERRWKYLKWYEKNGSNVSAKKRNAKKERLIQKCISNFPGAYQLYRKLVTAIDKEHYGSH